MPDPSTASRSSLRKFRDALNRLLEMLLILMIAILILDVLLGVVSRYVLKDQVGWTEELARVLLIWVGFLGAAVTFNRGGHLGVDFFTGLMDAESRRWMTLFRHLVVIVFAGVVMVGGGTRLVLDTLELEQMMMAIGIAKGWVYLVVPLSGAFIVLFNVEMLMETWMHSAQHPAEDPEL